MTNFNFDYEKLRSLLNKNKNNKNMITEFVCLIDGNWNLSIKNN
jgi:hypothetical protein